MKERCGGKTSLMRVVFVGWNVVVMLVWGWNCWTHGEIVTLPESIVYIIAATLAGKAAQRYAERPKEPPANHPPVNPPFPQ